ncbi:MAG: hypothetical protein KAX15_05600 [Candidatus Omnitrophica bacterium]|nr:hypothetical protein [Candidatus Omnitrophota bacterium]
MLSWLIGGNAFRGGLRPLLQAVPIMYAMFGLRLIHDRNREIVQGADQIYVFCYPGSRGSKSYVKYASQAGKKVRIFRVPFGK